MARGHHIHDVAEIPLVVDDAIESLETTSQVRAVFEALGAGADLNRALTSRTSRKGRAKLRNRTKSFSKGPLIIYAHDNGISLAVRNLIGIENNHVKRISLIKVAPGGHLGRFLIWTRSALETINLTWGLTKYPQKIGHVLPHTIVKNPDLYRIIHANEIQTLIKAPKSPYLKEDDHDGNHDVTATHTLRLHKYRKDLKTSRKKLRCIDAEFMPQSICRGKHFEAFHTWLGI